MKAFETLVTTFAPLLLLTACAAQSQSVLVSSDKAETRLIFVQPNDRNALDMLTADAPASLDEKAEATLLNQSCQIPTGATRSAIAHSILGAFVGPIVSWFVDGFETRLQEQLENYSATYNSQSGWLHLYASTDPLQTDYTCFRLVRKGAVNTLTASGQSAVRVDLLVSISLSQERDAIEIRPLRFYFDQGLKKSSDGVFGVAVSLSAQSVWRSANEGHARKVFTQTILTEKVDLSDNEPFLRYYDAGTDGDVITVPIVPLSSHTAGDQPNGRVQFSADVAEVGTTPVLLTAFASAFSGAKGELSALLTQAAREKAGL